MDLWADIRPYFWRVSAAARTYVMERTLGNSRVLRKYGVNQVRQRIKCVLTGNQNESQPGRTTPQLTDNSFSCQACYPLSKEPWWYNIDMIGHSIHLPLDERAVELLMAAELDPLLVTEILETHASHKMDFQRLIRELPTSDLEDVMLCSECWDVQRHTLLLEELCQLHDIVECMEAVIELEFIQHTKKWREFEKRMDQLPTLRFCDVPWPVRNPLSMESPDQLTRWDVHRFLFTRIVLMHHFVNTPPGYIYQSDMMQMLKDRWDTSVFEMRMEVASEPLTTTQRDILNGVSRIRLFLEEVERTGILTNLDPEVAPDNNCSAFQLSKL